VAVFDVNRGGTGNGLAFIGQPLLDRTLPTFFHSFGTSGRVGSLACADPANVELRLGFLVTPSTGAVVEVPLQLYNNKLIEGNILAGAAKPLQFTQKTFNAILSKFQKESKPGVVKVKLVKSVTVVKYQCCFYFLSLNDQDERFFVFLLLFKNILTTIQKDAKEEKSQFFAENF